MKVPIFGSLTRMIAIARFTKTLATLLKSGVPILTALSIVFTAVYQWGWTLKFLDPARLPLAATIFLVFPAMQVAAFVVGRDARRRE